MATGTIKFFNEKKRWGFIISDKSGHEIFFHCTRAKIDDSACLKKGQKVSFLVEKGLKGLEALHIKSL